MNLGGYVSLELDTVESKQAHWWRRVFQSQNKSVKNIFFQGTLLGGKKINGTQNKLNWQRSLEYSCLEKIAKASFKENAETCTHIHIFWPKFSTKIIKIAQKSFSKVSGIIVFFTSGPKPSTMMEMRFPVEACVYIIQRVFLMNPASWASSS